jgi:DNA-directed RNA polymerase subunit M/transcription elongation factor TFIIS
MDDDVAALSTQVIAAQIFGTNGMAYTQENIDFFAPSIARIKSALNDAFRLVVCEYATSHDPHEDRSLVVNTRCEIAAALVSFVPKIPTSDWLDSPSSCVVTHHAVLHVKSELGKFHDYNTEHYVEKMKRAAEARKALGEKVGSVHPAKNFTPMSRNVTCPKCKSHVHVHFSSKQDRKADEPSTWLYECSNIDIHGEIEPFNAIAGTLG